MEKELITPLEAIRIAKELNGVQMAECLDVSKTYITVVSHNRKNMSLRKLELGLSKLEIPLSKYFQLEEFRGLLLECELEHTTKYQLMLIKALGIVNQELQEETETILKERLENKVKMIKL